MLEEYIGTRLKQRSVLQGCYRVLKVHYIAGLWHVQHSDQHAGRCQLILGEFQAFLNPISCLCHITMSICLQATIHGNNKIFLEIIPNLTYLGFLKSKRALPCRNMTTGNPCFQLKMLAWSSFAPDGPILSIKIVRCTDAFSSLEWWAFCFHHAKLSDLIISLVML